MSDRIGVKVTRTTGSDEYTCSTTFEGQWSTNSYNFG